MAEQISIQFIGTVLGLIVADFMWLEIYKDKFTDGVIALSIGLAIFASLSNMVIMEDTAITESMGIIFPVIWLICAFAFLIAVVMTIRFVVEALDGKAPTTPKFRIVLISAVWVVMLLAIIL